MSEVKERFATVCPHCQKAAAVPAEWRGRQVRCPACKGTFAAQEKTTDNPPQRPADNQVPLEDQQDDLMPQESEAPAAAPPRLMRPDLTAAPVTPRVMVEAGVMCVNHPSVQAAQRCRKCNTAVCVTCDFSFPSGIHLCPTCATDTTVQLSTGRKIRLAFAFGAAVWVTLTMVILFAGLLPEVADEAAEAMLGLALTVFSMVPAMVGLGLALACLDKRRGNTPVVWVAVVWNILLCAVWLLLVIIGNMSG